MAKNVVKNLDKVIRQMQSFGKNVDSSIAQITEDNAQKIVFNAKIAAPSNKSITGGSLKQTIINEPKGKLNQVIYSKEKYAPYVEFGTGGLVSVPNELKELAIQFKGKGIKKINIQPQPFLYPAFVKGRIDYLKQLKDNLEVLTKRYG
jgi:HK97 gp10 family phage protein